MRAGKWLTSCVFVLVLVQTAARIPAQARVYRDRVEPHWSADGTRFWYRNDLPNDEREFVLVDAGAGSRTAAFDHAAVAQQLATLLGRDLSPEQLPVDVIEFADDRDSMYVTLIGPDGRFLWDSAASTLTKSGDAAPVSLEMFLPPQPSANSTEDTELVLINQLEEAVETVWISTTGERHSYGKLNAGDTRRQHTFVGHVWLLLKSDGTELGCLRAAAGARLLALTPEVLTNVRREERRRGRRRPAGPSPENPSSPDGAWIPFVRDHNLWLRSNADQSEIALTTDAAANNTFRRDAQRARSISMDYDREDFPDRIAEVVWSPDSRTLLAMQTTQVDERLVHYMESTPRDQLQPKLQSYPYLKPGDPIPVSRPRLFRIEDQSEIPIATDLFPNPWSLEFQRWSDDGQRFWLLYNERGHQRLRLLEVTAATGAVRAIIDEHSDTFIHYSTDGKFELRWLPNEQVLWASERSGWNHLYRYDLNSGEVLNPVTTGDWNVRRIERIEEPTIANEATTARHVPSPPTFHFLSSHRLPSGERVRVRGLECDDSKAFDDTFTAPQNPPSPQPSPSLPSAGTWQFLRGGEGATSGTIWFFAVGIVPGQDPYHEHFCRAALDGSGLTVLTDGDGTHEIEWSPDRRWFLDRYSRVDLPPVTELRLATGALVCQLEEADASEVISERRTLPERFVAKGRDGHADIHGIIHRPRDFDPDKRYAVIENIYAGPHDYHVPKPFRARWGHQQQIADAGFIVVQIDGMGTAWRSKAFHDVCWNNLRDAGFPDRIAWMKAAAAIVPQMDLSRVGIYGGSAGGQNAMAALLWHGDFYKAAVADCGCHDNRMDKIWWNEQWMGVPQSAAGADDPYVRNSNREHAHQLQGRLLLVVGELDRNVDPATTMQVARKLVEADKDFDLLIVPGAGHGACETPWASKRRTQFFVDAFGVP